MDIVNVAYFVLAIAMTVMPGLAVLALGLRDLRREARENAESEDE